MDDQWVAHWVVLTETHWAGRKAAQRAVQRDALLAVLMEQLMASHSAVQLAQIWADYWGSETVAPMVDQTAETWADWWAVQMELRRVEYLELHWVAHSAAWKVHKWAALMAARMACCWAVWTER